MPHPINALIIDDEPHARLYVRLLLQELGISTCWEASDGEEALTLFAAHDPQLVLLDVNLRMTTGLQVLEQIKRLRPDVPVIMMTSETAMKTVYEAERLGAVAYLLKTSPKDDSLASLRKTLAMLGENNPVAPGTPVA